LKFEQGTQTVDRHKLIFLTNKSVSRYILFCFSIKRNLAEKYISFSFKTHLTDLIITKFGHNNAHSCVIITCYIMQLKLSSFIESQNHGCAKCFFNGKIIYVESNLLWNWSLKCTQFFFFLKENCIPYPKRIPYLNH